MSCNSTSLLFEKEDVSFFENQVYFNSFKSKAGTHSSSIYRTCLKMPRWGAQLVRDLWTSTEDIPLCLWSALFHLGTSTGRTVLSSIFRIRLGHQWCMRRWVHHLSCNLLACIKGRDLGWMLDWSLDPEWNHIANFYSCVFCRVCNTLHPFRCNWVCHSVEINTKDGINNYGSGW